MEKSLSLVSDDLSAHKKIRKLSELMKKVSEAEDELISLTKDEITDLFGDVKSEVDNIHQFLNRLENISSSLDKQIKELKETKKYVDGNYGWARKYLAQMMQEQNTLELVGNNWVMKLRGRDEIKARSVEITTDHYLNLLDDNVIKREYSWDARRLKELFKRNPEKYKEYIEVTRSTWPSFLIRKDK